MKNYFNLPRGSKKRHVSFFLWMLFLTALFSRVYGQSPVKLWDKTYGGNAVESLHALEQTADGGYILGGYSLSDVSGDKTENSKQSSDFWIVKTDSLGNKLWDKTFGGSDTEILLFIKQLPDGNYIAGGYSSSNAGFDKSENFYGDSDYWLLKLDAWGNKLWDKTYGGNKHDALTSILQTADGGYILGGVSGSDVSGNKTDPSKGGGDYWLVKIDSIGHKLWDKSIGGRSEDVMRAVLQTADGGYILGGDSESDTGGDKSENRKGDNFFENVDFWVVKLDASGNKEWDKTIGGNSRDVLATLQRTSDGGYMLGGTSDSEAGFDKSEHSKGDADYWVVKLDASGSKQWDKTFGGISYDGLQDLQQTTDEGYILGGYSFTMGISGDKSEPSKGEVDYWLIKLDTAGNKVWDKTIGGRNSDDLAAVQQTRDGHYILAGNSNSNLEADKSADSKGEHDYWLVKLSSGSKVDGQITSVTLVNADMEQPIRELTEGDHIDLVALGNPLLTLQAHTQPDRVDSVLFELGSENKLAFLHVERIWPYVLHGDGLKAHSADYWGEYLGAGQYSLKVTPYWQGKADSPYTVNFQVTGDLPPALRANYGKSHTPAPAGWQKDYGLPFGQKGSYNYGWKRRSDGLPIDLSVEGTLPGNGRWRRYPSDLLLSSLMHMQGDDVANFDGTPIESYWELALENGDYQVTVSVGDGIDWPFPESHSINVEELAAISNFVPQEGTVGSISRFKQASVKVKVTDGYLTINADGGINNKINYVIIQPLFSSETIAKQARLTLQQPTKASVSVYPNPIRDKLMIQGIDEQGKVNLRLQDMMGRNLLQIDRQLETSTIELDLRGMALPKGMYLLQITHPDGKTQTLRVVKQ
jgi:hypothetical protein